MSPRRRDIALLELLEDTFQFAARDADAGIDNVETDSRRRPGSGLLLRAGAGAADIDRHPPALGELDAISGKIEQHLAQPHLVADQALGHVLGNRAGDIDLAGMGARRQQLDHAFHQVGKIEGRRIEAHALGFEL